MLQISSDQLRAALMLIGGPSLRDVARATVLGLGSFDSHAFIAIVAMWVGAALGYFSCAICAVAKNA